MRAICLNCHTLLEGLPAGDVCPGCHGTQFAEQVPAPAAQGLALAGKITFTGFLEKKRLKWRWLLPGAVITLGAPLLGFVIETPWVGVLVGEIAGIVGSYLGYKGATKVEQFEIFR